MGGLTLFLQKFVRYHLMQTSVNAQESKKRQG